MYCPRCGHQPISDAIRFCSYCGFKLGIVKASLAEDDESSMTVSTTQVIPKTPRQRDMNIGVILMFAGAIVLAISSLLMLGRMATPEFLFALIAAFVLLLIISKHLMRAVRYLVAVDADVALGDAVYNPALPPGQDVPVPLFTSQRVTTAEILTPASVTEQTTNLLENK